MLKGLEGEMEGEGLLGLRDVVGMLVGRVVREEEGNAGIDCKSVIAFTILNEFPLHIIPNTQ